MGRWTSPVVLFVVGVGLIAVSHYYLWARLVRDVGLAPSTARALTWVLCYESANFDIGHRADLQRAVAGGDPNHALILLAHQPRAVHEAVRHGVDLQLSGHTHGGQLWPLGWLLRVGQPVSAGLARFDETYVYVSRGTGSSGPPMRLAAPAEITNIVLRSA